MSEITKITAQKTYECEYDRPPTEEQWQDLKRRVSKGEEWGVNLLGLYLLDQEPPIQQRAVSLLKEVKNEEVNKEIVSNLMLMAGLQEVLEERDIKVNSNLFQKMFLAAKKLTHYFIDLGIQIKQKVIFIFVALFFMPIKLSKKESDISLDNVKLTDIKQKKGTNFCHVLGPLLALIHSGKFDLIKERFEIKDKEASFRFCDKKVTVGKEILLDEGEKQFYSDGAEWVDLLLHVYHNYLGDAMLEFQNADFFFKKNRA